MIKLKAQKVQAATLFVLSNLSVLILTILSDWHANQLIALYFLQNIITCIFICMHCWQLNRRFIYYYKGNSTLIKPSKQSAVNTVVIILIVFGLAHSFYYFALLDNFKGLNIGDLFLIGLNIVIFFIFQANYFMRYQVQFPTQKMRRGGINIEVVEINLKSVISKIFKFLPLHLFAVMSANAATPVMILLLIVIVFDNVIYFFDNQTTIVDHST